MKADLQQLRKDAEALASAELRPLPDDDLVFVLRTAYRLEQAVKVSQARMVREAASHGLPRRQGFRTVPSWLRALLCVDPQPARELAGAADALAREPAIEQAVIVGEVDLSQATVIAATIDGIPDTLAELDLSADGTSTGDDQSGRHDPISLAEIREIGERARATMIKMAGQLPAYQLRKVGDRILAYAAPDLSDRADEVFLERQQERAHKRRGFTLALPVDGLVRVSGLLDAEAAAIVQAVLHPLCRPIPGDDRPMAQRRADALVEICNSALRTAALPEEGGEPPQITVTVPYDVLANALNVGPADAHHPRANEGTGTDADVQPDADSRADSDDAGPGLDTVPATSDTSSPGRHALGVGTTDTGQRLPGSVVRRLACEARLLPAVLGARGRFSTSGAADAWSAVHYAARCTFATADALTPAAIVLHDGAAGTI